MKKVHSIKVIVHKELENVIKTYRIILFVNNNKKVGDLRADYE